MGLVFGADGRGLWPRLVSGLLSVAGCLGFWPGLLPGAGGRGCSMVQVAGSISWDWWLGLFFFFGWGWWLAWLLDWWQGLLAGAGGRAGGWGW